MRQFAVILAITCLMIPMSFGAKEVLLMGPFSTKDALPIVCMTRSFEGTHPRMNELMVRSVLAYYKIGRCVVGTNFIHVMDYNCFWKVFPKGGFSDNDMFEYVALAVGLGVFWVMHANIALTGSYRHSSLPKIAVFTPGVMAVDKHAWFTSDFALPFIAAWGNACFSSTATLAEAFFNRLHGINLSRRCVVCQEKEVGK